MLQRRWAVGCVMGAVSVTAIMACGSDDNRATCANGACLTTTTGGTTSGSAGTGGSGGSTVPGVGEIRWGVIGQGNGFAQKADCTAQDNMGNTYVGGYLEGNLGLGLGLSAPAGSSDTFLVKLGPDGNAIWGFTFGATGRLEPTAFCGLAVTTEGEVYFGADLAGVGTATFGVAGATQGTAPLPGDEELPVIVRIDPNGGYLGHITFGEGAQNPWIRDLAVSSTGVYVTGTLGLLVGDFLGTSIDSMNRYSIYVAKISLDLATPQWVKTYVAADNTGLSSVGIAVGSNNRVTTVGTFATDDLELDNTTLVSTGLRDIVILQHDDDDNGRIVAAQQFSGAEHQDAMDVAVLTDGSVVVVGQFESEITFGVGDAPFAMASTTTDPFVAMLDQNLNYVWHQTYEGMGTNQMRQVATVGNRLFVAGRYQSDIDFGVSVATGNSNNSILGELDPSDGATLWSVSSAPDAAMNLYSMSASSAGLAFAGSWSGSLMQPWVIGGEQLVPATDQDLSLFVGFVPIAP